MHNKIFYIKLILLTALVFKIFPLCCEIHYLEDLSSYFFFLLELSGNQQVLKISIYWRNKPTSEQWEKRAHELWEYMNPQTSLDLQWEKLIFTGKWDPSKDSGLVSLGVEIKATPVFFAQQYTAQAGVTRESPREIMLRVSDPALHVETPGSLYVSCEHFISCLLPTWFQEDSRQLDAGLGRRPDDTSCGITHQHKVPRVDHQLSATENPGVLGCWGLTPSSPTREGN